jgi:hypothetical protein
MKEAFGVVVNDLYDPDAIEPNHRAFAHDGVVVRSARGSAPLSLSAPPSKHRSLPRIWGT